MPQDLLGYAVCLLALFCNARSFKLLRGAMRDVSVDLGCIKVVGKKPSVSLTLSSSITVRPPPSWPTTLTPTAHELSQACSAGEIWISKGGSCQIELSSLVNDRPPASFFEPSLEATVVNLASECPVSTWLLIFLRRFLTFQGLGSPGTRSPDQPRSSLSAGSNASPGIVFPAPS